MVPRRRRKNFSSVVFSGRRATISWNRSHGGLKKLHYKNLSSSCGAIAAAAAAMGMKMAISISHVLYDMGFSLAARYYKNGRSPYENEFFRAAE